MLEKPDIQDELLVGHLYNAYSLSVSQIVFLPLGADVNTAVYRVEADDGRAYFLKLRGGPLDEMSVAVPAFLGDEGMGQIIAPLKTTAGQLWSSFDSYTVTLYPFVVGVNGFKQALSDEQWIEFGAILKRVHSISLPPTLSERLPHETYTPQWRDQVRAFQAQTRADTFEDPIDAALATLMQAKVAEIDQLVEAAEGLAQLLQARSDELVLCHADIHAGNLLITATGELYVVDWDTLLLAPKERDLMFIGSGLGPGWGEARGVELFYQGYGPTAIDRAALVYYRCERIVQDIAAFCEEILEGTTQGEDRPKALRILSSQFEPNDVVEIALRSYREIEA